MVFEFIHAIVLRGSQVDIIREFVTAVRGGQPLVKQMLMGGGKTTVVGPLLALILGDGETLVVQTMPPALMEQSIATLRATFSLIIRKRVYTMTVDRSSPIDWRLVDKLATALRHRGVVCCTPQTLKSLQLKLVEKLVGLNDPDQRLNPSSECEVRMLVSTLRTFKRSCLIMDEVDCLLHPLKSELNFPIGAKHTLDLAPERWLCAIHALDAVFFLERGSCTAFQKSTRAASILSDLSDVIEAGYEKRALQRSPHLVLLDEEWYALSMLPVMAKWMTLWLETQHVSVSATRMAAYLTRDEKLVLEEAWEPAVVAAANAVTSVDPQLSAPLRCLHAFLLANVDPKQLALLNLAADWLRVFLPHVLCKVYRVTFGLLTDDEFRSLKQLEPNMPRSRFKLAIPFLGKDGE